MRRGLQLAVRSAQAQLMAAADARSGDMAEQEAFPTKKYILKISQPCTCIPWVRFVCYSVLDAV